MNKVKRVNPEHESPWDIFPVATAVLAVGIPLTVVILLIIIINIQNA